MWSPSFSSSALTTAAGSRTARLFPHFATCINLLGYTLQIVYPFQLLINSFRCLGRQRTAQRALQLQKPSLHIEPAAVAAEGPVGRDHAVAGNDNRHRISIVCHSHRTKTLGPSYRARNVAVGASLAVGNRQQRSP